MIFSRFFFLFFSLSLRSFPFTHYFPFNYFAFLLPSPSLDTPPRVFPLANENALFFFLPFFLSFFFFSRARRKARLEEKRKERREENTFHPFDTIAARLNKKKKKKKKGRKEEREKERSPSLP